MPKLKALFKNYWQKVIRNSLNAQPLYLLGEGLLTKMR